MWIVDLREHFIHLKNAVEHHLWKDQSSLSSTIFLLIAQIDEGVTKEVDKLPVTEEARCFNLHDVWYSVPPRELTHVGCIDGVFPFRDRNIQTPKETPLTISSQPRLSTLTTATLELHAPSPPTVDDRVLICARSGAGAFSIDY
jgi:hypothetical protein